MSMKLRILLGAVVLGTLAGGIAFAQRYRRIDHSAHEIPPLVDRHGIDLWENEPQFKNDVFTFVRIRWHSWRGGDIWLTDYPDSDLNFSFRLQQLTSLKVDPHPKQLDLTDEEIFDYPFIYMLEVGSLEFTDEEVANLRKYLLNGGFLMVDDFWGEYAWRNFEQEMKRVFPDRESKDLDISDPIFHCVFDLKQKPQIPGIDTAREVRAMGHPEITWEREDAREPHYRAFYDDKGRMMAIICQNTDLGDGWEREGEEEWYFHQFSEKQAYPMGINIVFWAMTH
ncbi:MAG TPA: DUF4159 domain-containing protein [Tepidisphaeraceae bacterium]|jgi:hypothetical protein